MKSLFLALLLLPITAYPQGVNLATGSSQQKLISAVGDANMARALQSDICSHRDTVLTSAEIDALNATPIELVPAPGAGKSLFVCSVVAWLNYNSTAWAGSSETIPLKYGTAGTTITTITEAFMERTSDGYQNLLPVDGVGAQDNTAIYATANADFTTGNSPLSVRVYYRTVGGSTILE